MNSNDLQRFTGYANNVLIKIFNCFEGNKLELIDHFLGDDIYNKISKLLKKNDKKYDNLKLNSFYISDIEEKENEYKLKYYVSFSFEEINETIKKVNKEYILVFVKNKKTKEYKENIKCLNCGSNMDINNNGKCEYCGSVYNLEDYDWILTDIKKV